MMWMCRYRLVLILSLACDALTQTQARHQRLWEPPDWHFQQNIKKSVPKEMLSSLQISGYPIQLEKTSLADVEKHFGGKIDARGDAGDAVQWLCFHGSDASGNWVLWLESGEIDGGDVGSFEWRRVSAEAEMDHRCVALGGQPQLPLPLHLGMELVEVVKTLGQPSWQSPQRVIYMHEHEEIINGERYDSSNIVMLRVRSGVVWAIAVSKTTTS